MAECKVRLDECKMESISNELKDLEKNLMYGHVEGK